MRFSSLIFATCVKCFGCRKHRLPISILVSFGWPIVGSHRLYISYTRRCPNNGWSTMCYWEVEEWPGSWTGWNSARIAEVRRTSNQNCSARTNCI